jgi:putative ABC transport system permease protein
MTNFPATYMTAVHIPSDKTELLNQISRQFPTVSVISVAAIITQVNDIIAQVSVALSVIMVLVFAAAILVLIAQVQASLDQREQEIAILRTLGASKQFLLKASVYEYLVLGVLAGGFATLLVEVLLSSLQVRLFELPFQLHPMLWWMGPTLGALIIVSLAMVQLKGLLNMPSAV